MDPARREDPPQQVTQLLIRVNAGDACATDELFPAVYEELRRLAADQLSRERAGHTLQPTALVHEAYLRLVGDQDTPWQNRRHFFGAAAKAVRRILIDHARSRGRAKRGAGEARLDVTALDVAGPTKDLDLLALDEALDRLAALDPEKARLVELRFFAGLTGAECAAALGISESTEAREWRFVRAWLHREVSKGN